MCAAQQDGATVLVRLLFALAQDAGWPPAPHEEIWAQPLGDGRYSVETPPWYVRGLAVRDIVEAAPGEGGLWAGETLRWGGRLTVRVLPLPEGPLNGDPQEVRRAFAPLGVLSGEPSPQYGIVALDIPREADLRAVKALLLEGEALGSWDIDESRVSDEWTLL